MVLGNMQGFPSIVRIAQLSRADVSKILDYGAAGVMVPMVETAEQARQLVQWSKYPPLGKRSYSGGANTHYAPGGHHEQHMRELNENVMSIVQIETRQGVERIKEILDVKGIDGVLIGPCDLAISLGWPDDLMRTEEQDMIRCVAKVCRGTGCRKRADSECGEKPKPCTCDRNWKTGTCGRVCGIIIILHGNTYV